MHFTVYLTVKLHRSFNCNFTFIYNSVQTNYFMSWYLWNFNTILVQYCINCLKSSLERFRLNCDAILCIFMNLFGYKIIAISFYYEQLWWAEKNKHWLLASMPVIINWKRVISLNLLYFLFPLLSYSITHADCSIVSLQ